MTTKESLELAMKWHRHGALADAEQMYRHVLEQEPNNSDALHMLGLIASHYGNYKDAIALIQRAIQLNPQRAEYYGNLGIILTLAYRHEDALAYFHRALELNPNYALAHSNLGAVLLVLGRPAEAKESCQRAIDLRPKVPESHYNLANALTDLGELNAAIVEYEKAIELNPKYSSALNNLGNVYKATGQIDKAVEVCRRAIEVDPTHVMAHSNLIFGMYFQSDATPRQIHGEQKRWSDRFAKPLAESIKPHDNDRSPDRRLRIGYVSADFRAHPVACFLLPLFPNHRPEEVEIFCYSGVRRSDEITERLRGFSHHWRDATKLPDAELAETIRADKIDILIDLGLHTAENRLLMFARKPAPIQMTWLGFPGATGLSTIDYRITDPYLDPPGESDEFYTEKSLRLPSTAACYQPMIETPPVGPLPAASNGFVTFGSFNNFAKLSAPCIELWIRILQSVENSRLLIKAQPGSHIEALRTRFENSGIEKDRLEFLGRAGPDEYFPLFDRMDICLDSFPYCGQTTTCDALWMGVPVVSLSGPTSAARAGKSILSNVGLPELIAEDAEQYLSIAKKLANDIPHLIDLRKTLREKMQSSPLTDGPRFAKDLEAIYRSVWRERCARELR
ncbi:MAG: tetratricopeptide repeat protein [Tepidisphaeraceae bacterium]